MQVPTAKGGYDEVHDLSNMVMELKLSIANLSKLKKQLGIDVGDK